MVPEDFRKTTCLAAGCVTLVVAVLWEIASIYSLGVYNCAWSFLDIENSGVTTWSMFYITYFMGGCKSKSDASALGFNFTPPSSPAENLQVWMWISTLVTALWIPACVLLIVAAMSEVRGRAGAALYYPWVSLSAALVILDLAATVYYLVNVFSTTTADEYATFTGASDWSTLTGGVSSDGVKTWLPSLYITLFFCRFLVFWLLDVYFVFTVYRASCAVSRYKTKYLQNTVMTEEKQKTWKDKFFRGPDPKEFDHQKVFITRRPHLSNTGRIQEQEEMREVQPPRSPSLAQHPRSPSLGQPPRSPSLGQPPRSPILAHTTKSPSLDHTRRRTSVSSCEPSHSAARYKVDEWGIPIEELNNSYEPREISYNKDEGYLPRSPFQLQATGNVYDYTGRPLSKLELNNERSQVDNAPPMASGVEVPAELNRNRPFSYMAGDQPQLLKRPVSRSNSKASDYPVIPRPDYTIADRRKTSLEYVPNRFKLPAPSPAPKPQVYARAALRPRPQESDEDSIVR